VQHAHEALLATAAHARVGATATTLTIAIALWPRAIILHAGDSRCYRWRDGVLECLTTDQTMAQALIAAGALQPTADAVPRLRNVLVSALGASQLEVEVVTDELRLTDRWLLCTDGLTRHVSDAEIAERLGGSGSAEAICQDLLALALARGGEDNVTVVAGRLRER
jgi:protein phosphatase